MLRTGGICSDVRQVHFGLFAGRQLDLGFLCSLFETLHSQRITGQGDTGIFLELVSEEVDQAQIEILTTKEGVTVGGQHFELLLTIDISDFDNRHVKGTAAEVIHGDLAVLAVSLVHAVGQRRRGRLVDNALYFQTSNTTSIFRSLTLGVVKIGRHGNHRLSHFLAEIILSGFLHFLQHLGRNLRRRQLLVAGLYPGIAVIGLDDLVRHHLDVFLHNIVSKTTANQALHRKQGVGRVGNSLTLGGLTNQHFVVVGIGDDGRRGTRAFAVFQNLDLVTFHHGNTGVGGTQVNTDDLTHYISPFTSVSGPCRQPEKLILISVPIWRRLTVFQVLAQAFCQEFFATTTRAGRIRRPFSR